MKRLARDSLGTRIKVLEGDFWKEDIPAGYNAIIMANVLHLFSPEANAELLRKIRRFMPAGGRLLLVDFWMDVNHLEPLAAALLAGEFLLGSGEGDV